MVDDRSRRRVSSTGELEHLMYRAEFRIFRTAALVEGGENPRCADLVLQSAVQPVPRVERIAGERQIADLPRRSVSPADELVVDDDPHPDARPDRDEHHRGDATRQAEPLLADRREIHVVLDEHRQIETVADHLERIESALRCNVVGQGGDPSADLVHDPGRGDPERQRSSMHGAGLIDHLADHLKHLHPHGSAAVLCRGTLQVA